MSVELKYRFGGHGNILTKWEISTDCEWAKKIIINLPDLWPIQHSTEEHKDYFRYSLILPAGTSLADAGIVAAALTSWNEEGLRVKLVELQAKAKRNPVHETLWSDTTPSNTRVACAFIHNEDFSKVLLAKRYENSKFDAGKWETPGGKVEEWEEEDEGVLREIEEELGVHFLLEEPVAHIHNLVDRDPEGRPAYKYDIVAFVGTIDGEPQPLAASELRWWPIVELTKEFTNGNFCRSFGPLFSALILYRQDKLKEMEKNGTT